MRPVVKGVHPINKDKQNILFNKYGDARLPLMTNMGFYCSYCEIPCYENPQVEHIQPKTLRPDLLLKWNNFLLSCGRCNTIKSKKEVNIKYFYWPHRDNTFRAFTYVRDNIPLVNQRLTDRQKEIAQNTIELFGLDRHPGHAKWSKTDPRYRERRNAWSKALLAQERLEKHPFEAMREQIVETAKSTGFWSVWMNVFINDSDMRSRLIDAFPGTAGLGICFNDDLSCKRRQNGRL